MYCLVYTRSSLCTAALIFYTIVWLPLLQLKKSLLGCVSSPAKDSCQEMRLPAARFGDLKRSRSSRSDDDCKGEEESPCSICLAEMEEDEAVSELPRCGHIFHLGCIESWLERCQFTCPLCRGLLFEPCKASRCC